MEKDNPSDKIIENQNPEFIFLNDKKISTAQLLEEYEKLKRKSEKKDRFTAKALRKLKEIEDLKPYQAELIKLQNHLEKINSKMMILFEGRDASGKGGTIRRVTRYMNEKHYRVVALGKPTEEQKTQWYFQRYVQHFPHSGEIVLFDRSWYNRSMVEPVFGFCTQKEYDNFIKGVKGFEKDLVRQGIILVKLYFSVTKDEQALRFERRKTDPLRQWKLSEVDLQAQDKWDEFTVMKYKMLEASHSRQAPWTIIRSNDKHTARKEAMKVILNQLNYEGRNMDLDFTLNTDIVVSGAHELEIMDRHMKKEGKFIY
ncbi:MAG TPA: polyphosphate kinase 2 [Bacteroidetes bacterium]|nr:polyphosphate kinase 2 [Bacteroidota bacterium]